MRKLGQDLADEGRTVLTERARSQLAQTTTNYVSILQRQIEVLKLLLGDQAREVEIRLAGPVPPKIGRIVFDSDIDDGKVPFKIKSALATPEGASHRPLRVTDDTQAFRLPRGATAAPFHDEIARLDSMTAVYRQMHDAHPNLIVRQYTTLANGLHSVYPGRGGYPANYDPRQRPWYQVQLQSPGLRWTPPLKDIVSGQVTFGLSMPIRSPRGQFAGVTGFDVPINALLNNLPLPSGWGHDSRTFVVALQPDTQGHSRIAILGKQFYTPAQTADGSADEWLDVQDAGVRRGMVDAFRKQQSGIVQTRFMGQESLLAFRPIGERDTFLVIALPYERAVEYARSVHTMALEKTQSQLRTSAIITLAVVVIVVLVALANARTLTRPILRLAEATRRVAGGDLDTRVVMKTGDEIEQLADAFNAMVPQLKERLQMSRSLALAREVQQNLIPKSSPNSRFLDLAGTTIYCDATGGDYYDFIDLLYQHPGRMGVLIGDVSGHGISSALVMTTARALLHSLSHHVQEPAEVMRAVNQHLARDINAGRFMTLYYLVIDTQEHRLRWVSAGHNPAILYRAGCGDLVELAGDDIPLGVEQDWAYREAQRDDWQAGDVVVMATDGVWEARNATDETFGKKRLNDVIRAYAGLSAQEIATAVTDAVADFRGGSPQTDDITVVVAKALA
jgi:sigma-B regulation protein RsbU (phosphoserine phosphatase)